MRIGAHVAEGNRQPFAESIGKCDFTGQSDARTALRPRDWKEKLASDMFSPEGRKKFSSGGAT